MSSPPNLENSRRGRCEHLGVVQRVPNLTWGRFEMSSPPNLENSSCGHCELSVVQSFLIFFIWIGISYGSSGAIFYCTAS